MKMGLMGAELFYGGGRMDGHDEANSRFSKVENAWNYDPLLLYDIMVCGKINYAVTTVLRV